MQKQDRNPYVFNVAQITAEQAKKVMTWNTPLDVSIEFLREENVSVLRKRPHQHHNHVPKVVMFGAKSLSQTSVATVGRHPGIYGEVMGMPDLSST